ncbi:MAG: tRNA (N6-isopentenyl adenosine(37)-C2)-methylthiotransferase MiaB [bacterium]
MSSIKKSVDKYFKPDLKKARKRLSDTTEKVLFESVQEHKTLGTNKFYNVQTYGCQGNEADSETICGIMESLGFTRNEDATKCDVVILNTCAIRENAENRIWGVLGNLKHPKRLNPNMVIGICGCMPQEENVVDKILQKYREVNLVFGTHNIYKLPEYILELSKNEGKVIEVFSEEGKIIENLPKIRNNTHKAWVNIMYGCDEFCTYCIVPYTRGKERSRDKDDIINEVKRLVENGYQEITLLGQNVNAFGKDRKDGYTFGDLLKDLDETGIPRIRYTTSHPRDLDDLTIEAMATCKSVMPHIHLPVQSGDTEILRKMNRKYTYEEYMILINKLKKSIPSIAITTDIIVGFPNESVEQFENTLKLVDEVQYEGAFTFVYSRREGTPAAKYDDTVSEDEKSERLQILNKKINDGYLKGNERFLNKIVKVLVDGSSAKNDEKLCGYSEHMKLVNFEGEKELIGKIVSVRITEVKTWSMVGEIVNE